MTRPTDYFTAMRLFYGHRGCIGWGNITDGPGDLDEIIDDTPTTYPPHPDDYCRTCRGKGLISEIEYRPQPVQVWQDCPSCNGRGYGK